MNENAYWFYYTHTNASIPIARKGSFDMRDMVWWEGVQNTKGDRMSYKIFLRCVPGIPVVLDETNFQAFARKWAELWKEKE